MLPYQGNAVSKKWENLKAAARVGVREISYGQDVHRRIGTAVAVGVFTLGVGALIALSKSKKHVDCHPEAAESRAQASDSQPRACPEPAEGIFVLPANSDATLGSQFRCKAESSWC
jgi:hypothetical protein